MFGVKGILSSKTIWANVFTLVAGTTLGAKYLAGVDPGAVADLIAQVGVVLGPIVSSIFRKNATQQIVVGGKA